MKDEDITREQLISELIELRKKNAELEIIKLNITKHKLIELELNESKRKHETLLSNLPGMVYRCLHDEDWNLEYVSEGCQKLTGYNFDDLVRNKTVSFAKDVIHPDDLEAVGVDVDSALSEKRPFTCIYRIITADGNTKWVWEQGRGIFSPDGRLLAIEGFITDITEQKKLEGELRRAQKLESLGILAGGIAHDFNNILTAILGNISLADSFADSDSKDNMHKALKEAEKASLRAKGLSQQLLTFASGGLPVKKVISVGGFIKEAAGFALKGSNVVCEYSISNDLAPVEVDEGQIGQVIQNLIINACQAMPEGGVINVHAENINIDSEKALPLKPGRYVKISIKDQGVGIPQKHISKIFDPYFTTKQTGSGLGLATTYSIIRNHGGYITVNSKVGEGTTFCVYLPATDKKVDVEMDTGKGSFLGQGRILIMDDEEIIRNFACDALRHFGYEVDSAISGDDAINLYKRAGELGQPFNAVILDLTVPGGMGGKETVKELLKIDPGANVI
ncbi:MAG TPA: ATP-binding protein, partial [Thermodesulfovibrionales bacterium]|nr:ATP-binding protein [Thermodesulfovibrionales bacterium]